jgi:predicted urease superfamily metal-dependent hydrolase
MAPSFHRQRRTEVQIVEELEKLSVTFTKHEDGGLHLHIRQGECFMEAADAIRDAGGTEKWLAKHHIDLGITGKSRTAAANVFVCRTRWV